ncbi:hypothetical protein AAFX24_13390 [Vibrio mediterranei]
MHLVITVGFFFCTGLFYKAPVGERKQAVEQFFINQKTPIVSPVGMEESDIMQSRILGRLTLIFGGVISAFFLVPNEHSYYFLVCGLFIVAVGALIYSQSLANKPQVVSVAK